MMEVDGSLHLRKEIEKDIGDDIYNFTNTLEGEKVIEITDFTFQREPHRRTVQCPCRHKSVGPFPSCSHSSAGDKEEKEG